MSEASAIDALREQLGGEVIGPADAGYEEHRRVWNGSIDKRPSVIARCAGVADVIAAVRFAREHEMLTAVRGGGHSFPGLSTCDGGIVIDLSPMKAIAVDPETRVATVQAGALLGELDAATQPYGLAVPAGIVTHTGVAGLTLGGGIGWQHRKYGLSIDNLRSVDLITAEGEFVKASEEENADLFWGVRGGGGNFGIVTEFEFDANPIGPMVLAGPVFWLMKDAPEVLRFYRDWVAECPDELMTIIVTRRAPDIPIVPRELVGEHVIGVVVCWAGEIEEGERFVQPLKALGSPALDLCTPMPFLTLQALLDPGFVPGAWYYVRSCDVAALNDDIVDIVAAQGEKITSPITSIALWQMGGAVAKVGEGETAFNGRDAGFTFNINGNTLTGEGFEAERQWARDYWTALEPWHTGVYVNFLMEEGEERIREAYGAARYDRLKALKQKYDPTNLFRLNQNIKPD
ncbi:MAG TPA: FAD-binding oxidoreductase [Actinomycetota bacterium]